MKLDKLKKLPKWQNNWAFAGAMIEKYGINLEYNGEYWFSSYLTLADYSSCHHIGVACGFAPCKCRAETPLGTLKNTYKTLKDYDR